MTTKNYFIVENNVVTNDVVWDGNIQTWNPPTDSIQLIQTTTPALVWVLDKTTQPASYKLEEKVGAGDIGFTWNGSVLTTNEPKPAIPTTT